MHINVIRGDFRKVTANAAVVYHGMFGGRLHAMLAQSRGTKPTETLVRSIRRASKPLHAVVAASHDDHAGSFQHVVFAINHFLPGRGRDVVYSHALRRASLEDFDTLTIPICNDMGDGVKPNDFAMGLRLALMQQSASVRNRITAVNLVADDDESHNALTARFSERHL